MQAFILKKIGYLCINYERQMIQRIQTLYLLVAALFSAGLIFVFDLWQFQNSAFFYAFDGLQESAITFKVLPLLFFGSAALSLFTVFKYSNRQTQFVLVRLNILINLILLGLLVYLTLSLSGETAVSEKGIGSALPIAVIVLLVMANRAIRKDEELVKSVDRLR